MERPALVVLDLVLSGADGVELMTGVSALARLAVIFLSARGREETVARAVDAGTADCIVKPFSPAELAMRVRPARRRRERPAPFVPGELAIGYGSRLITVAGHEADLAATANALLRARLTPDGWSPMKRCSARCGAGRNGDDANFARIFVRNLRRKRDDDASRPGWIFNQRGAGNRMPDPRGR